jgi:hypothetical protein
MEGKITRVIARKIDGGFAQISRLPQMHPAQTESFISFDTLPKYW